MEFVKLRTNYYLDLALLRAGEAAEVLFTRGLAYAGDQETDGFIPTEALALIVPTRAKARAAALVREGLWVVVTGGWTITGYVKHQVTSEQLEQRRKDGRERVAAHRARIAALEAAAEAAGCNTVTDPVTACETYEGEVRGKRLEASMAGVVIPFGEDSIHRQGRRGASPASMDGRSAANGSGVGR